MTNIYTLADPRTGDVRYVGQSRNLSSRFKKHRTTTESDGLLRYAWVQELKEHGLLPVMHVVEVVDDDKALHEEHKWIMFYAHRRCRLFNRELYPCGRLVEALCGIPAKK